MKLIDPNEVHLRLSYLTHDGQINAEDAFQAVEDCDDMQIHAHWEVVPTSRRVKNIPLLIRRCSNCGDYSNYNSAYCSTCGAKMDERVQE